MAKITITYPESWLEVSISVKDRITWVEAFSWVMDEAWWVYNYDFIEEPLTDYIYTATTPWYDDVNNVVWQETITSWWWISWDDLIENNSSVVGSFWQKFSQYGGVSHVIDRSSFDEASKKELEDIKSSMKKISEDIQKSIANIKPPQIVSEWKTTVVKYNDAQQNFIQEFITETIPELADKIDNLIPLLKTYEELILDFEQKEKDYEKLIEELINNK